ncbi:peptidoglycan-recognition protein SC2-like [Atheta coriaria]|uniref:peptidoglycan-recognition protein SC2-like n=1 Tax=Dalotia coriaria TaxID=877792 RepID=UPI0031F3B6D3
MANNNFGILLFLWSNMLIYCGLTNAYATGTIAMNIILREEWNAREPIAKHNLTERPAPYVVIHHSATRSCFSEAKCKRLVKSFQNFHMDTRKWDDIAYNFVIGQDGNVYEGRGWGLTGSHATSYNKFSVGICIAGTFTDYLPNEKAMNALKQLINYGVVTGEIKDDYKLIGHRQATATECPGKTLYETLQSWSHWTPDTIDQRRR